MIAQAFNAELFKLLANRWSFFWAFAFVPLVTLLAGLGDETFAHYYAGDLLPYADLVMYAYTGLGTMQASIAQLFAIVGAAILFAGEYRWETWRAILPRNERAVIMLAKLGVFAFAISACVLACGLARFAVGLYDAALTGEASWPPDPLPALLLGFAAAVIQLMATAALVMAVSVATRSMMAAIVAPLLLLFALEVASLRIRFADADLWTAILPNIASRALREQGMLLLGDGDAMGTHLAVPGAIALILWTILLATAAIAWFRMQDLSRE